MKVFKLEAKQFIRRPLEEVFGFFSRPENLVVITSQATFQNFNTQPTRDEARSSN
tara:strand:+ start:166 stop:330 length:165 start_codon:yes stop_codon:yes gene_type:complete